MKIKLSKSQWQMIGQKTGWMKKANDFINNKRTDYDKREEIADKNDKKIDFLKQELNKKALQFANEIVTIKNDRGGTTELDFKFAFDRIISELGIEIFIEENNGQFKSLKNGYSENFEEVIKELQSLTKDKMISIMANAFNSGYLPLHPEPPSYYLE